MKSKEIIVKCLFVAVIVLFVIGLVFNFRYIVSLEEQVYQRDSLIRELSFSDQLVREYFDVHVDTLNNTRSYTLKDEKKTRIIERQEYSIEMDGKKYSFEQLLQQYINLAQDYNSLVRDFNALAKKEDKSRMELADSKRTIGSLYLATDSLRNLLDEKNFYLNSVTRRYGVVYQTQKEGNTTHYVMKGSPQLDSALRIFPYFKDMAVFDGENNEWVISIPNKKRIETVVRISYR